LKFIFKLLLPTTIKPSGAGLIAANKATEANTEDVTSVPKKGVDNLLADTAPSVPKKGVPSLDHITQVRWLLNL